MWRKIFSQLNLFRFGLALTAVAVIMIFLPHADRQSYSYELNQPWKYPLLTAEFDIPIYRDSASIRMLRDSIDRKFVPFVKRDRATEEENIERLNTMTAEYASPSEIKLLDQLLRQTYNEGIVDQELYKRIHENESHSLRLIEDEKSGDIQMLDGEYMHSPRDAFAHIDTLLTAKYPNGVPAEITKALSVCLIPNITLDTVTDSKYRNQEYLTVTGAMGVIKTGQRIVDRGEIITPQIYTNLTTYYEKMATLESENENQTYFLIGQGIYIATVFAILYLYLAIYRPAFFSDLRKMTFLISFITLFSVFAVIMFEYINGGIYLVPYAALPVIVIVFFDSRTAIFSLIAAVLIGGLVATYQFQFIFMELTAGLIATFSILQLSRRSQLLMTALYTFISYTFTYFIFCLITVGNLSQFSLRMVGFFAINSVILSFAYVLILIIEKIFGFTSTVSLVELSDINNPLLRRLAETAPGTFQHSLQVSTIAAEAARAIGANTTLVRTGALYHDIGKLSDPIYFTENQHGTSPHSDLTPKASAKKIISHVTEGVSLASKAKLPAVIKSFILEHHGKGMAKYFYNTAVNQNPDKVINKEDFSYPGPNPQSVETAILMMADSVEAASRSLTDYTPQEIDNLVDKIINSQIADGLFREAPITFKDVETIKKVFKSRLATIYHTRVRYPEMNKNTATAAANATNNSEQNK